MFIAAAQAPPNAAPGAGIAAVGGNFNGTTLRNAEIDALIEAKSYFNLNEVESYFHAVETRDGGSFPIGTNKVWHGGVHFPVSPDYPFVFAAACGTIVAARLSSNAETEGHAKFGSQRFVLVRHAVYLDSENDPEGVGTRVRYSLDGTVPPRYVFSLYMHLSAVADIANPHAQNPPWFNRWRENNPGTDIGLRGAKGIVFNPDVEVSVGDVLGKAGTFRGRPMLHFEIVTHRDVELTMAPWNDASFRAVDNDSNAMCDVATLDRYLQDVQGDGIDPVDVLRAAPTLRRVKAFHKSEWALSSPAQVTSLIPGERRRRAYWPHFERCSWVADAVAANADLANQLGDANGMFWHYHPITFMEKVNTLVAQENREVAEQRFTDTNVQVDEDGYLTEFVAWSPAANAFQPSRADNANIHTELTLGDSDLSTPGSQTPVFRFQRRHIACQRCVAAAAGPAAMPTATKFAVGLLELLERVRRHYNSPVTIEQGYVCATCRRQPGNPCCTGTVGGLDAHAAGCAADIRPTAQTTANCRSLWSSITAACDAFNADHSDTCGAPSEDMLPLGYNRVECRAFVRDAAGNPQQLVPPFNVAPAQAASFRAHISLVAVPPAGAGADTSLTPVRLTLRFVDLLVLDDQDWFGKGEWKMSFFVNGRLARTLDRSLSTGERVLLDWVEHVELEDNEQLRLEISGKEIDLIFDDSLGGVRVAYGKQSSPAWGLGARRLRSSNGSFEITVEIESTKSDY